jgi:tetratricopeptide (TPR) repeat protein
MAQIPPPASSSRLDALLAMVERDPTDAFCLYGVAQEYAKLGRAAEALPWYDRCLAADPTYAYACFHKARALEELDRVDEAIATLRDGLIRARAAGDGHAAAEIAGYIDQIS